MFQIRVDSFLVFLSHSASVHLPRIGHSTPQFNWYGTERLIRKHLASSGVPTHMYPHIQKCRHIHFHVHNMHKCTLCDIVYRIFYGASFTMFSDTTLLAIETSREVPLNPPQPLTQPPSFPLIHCLMSSQGWWLICMAMRERRVRGGRGRGTS